MPLRSPAVASRCQPSPVPTLRTGVLVCALLALLCASAGAADPAATGKPEDAVLLEQAVLPLLKKRCGECHNSTERKAELDLSTAAGVLRGGESGEAVVRSKPEESLLYEMVHDGLMPPEGSEPLTKAEIELIRGWIAAGARTKTATAEVALTQHDIIPIVNLRCTVCHGLRKQEAGLDLRTRASMIKGGKSGPAMVPGSPETSLMLKRIHAREMPPGKKLIAAGVRPVEPAELEILTKWIAAGSPEVEVAPDVATGEPDPLVTDDDRQFWAFQPPQKPAVPAVQPQNRVRNAIDAFVLRKLEAEGLSLSPEADRQTLIRRVAFDLTGLPPEWAHVEEFLNDTRPDAYMRMVERYLASPAYGERWGQYWLDLAGYSDSEGKRSADVVRQFAWRYRDYVIRSFNDDRPYDEFLLQQIAGDELVNWQNTEEPTAEMLDCLVATGFLRMAPDGTGSDVVNTVVERMEVITDELHVLGSGVLGLTIGCARCHSHKYDPIPQRDYYRLVATFAGAYDLHDWLKSTSVRGQTDNPTMGRTLPLASPEERAEYERQVAKVEEQIEQQQQRVKAAREKLHGMAREKLLASLEAAEREQLTEALDTEAASRTAAQKKLLAKYKAQLKPTDAVLMQQHSSFRKLSGEVNKKVAALKKSMPAVPGIRALWDRGVPSPVYIFRRGEYNNPGRLVGPGVPSVLTDGRTPFKVTRPFPDGPQTGRRLALARWLVEPDHPLTARVMVNRIWNHHFGRGIVRTLDNFGNTGMRPTHPELLDWLAVRFVDEGWSIKAMHRLMLASSTYRQVSELTEELEAKDELNDLFSRMPLMRMNAEAVRDSLLAVAGELEGRRFGQPDPVKVRPDGLVTSKRGEAGWRRSIYVLHRRKEMPTMLETFDLPQMIPNCIARPSSTVASQALHLMNNGMVHDVAASLAGRLEREAGDDDEARIEHLYRLALSRNPTSEELGLTQQALAELTTAWIQHVGKEDGPADATEARHRALSNVCHSLLNSAAFLYID